MSTPILSKIDPAGVAAVCLANCAGQGLLLIQAPQSSDMILKKAAITGNPFIPNSMPSG